MKFCCTTIRFFAISIFCCAFFPLSAIGQVFFNGEEEAPSTSSSPLIQAQRETIQKLKTAEKMIQEKHYTDGVRLLWQLMKESDDAFVTDSTESSQTEKTPADSDKIPAYSLDGDFEDEFDDNQSVAPTSQQSLKAYIQRIIGQLPPQAQAASELVVGTEAKQALEKALESGSINQLSDVSRTYYHTKAGYQATFLLATALLYDGQSYSACLTYERMAKNPEVRNQFEPAFSVLWLNSLILSQQQEAKKEIFTQLKNRLARMNWSLEDKSLTGFQNIEQIEAYLSAFDFRRSAVSSDYKSPLPLLLPRWSALTYDSPMTKAYLDTIGSDLGKQRLRNSDGCINLNFCTFEPAVSNNTVFIRTIFGISALDLTTGKRLWDSSSDLSNDILRRWTQTIGVSEKSNLIGMIAPAIQLRCQYDYTYGALRCDDKFVYAIEDIWKNQLTKAKPGQTDMMFLTGVSESQANTSTNRLAAYDIKTGKLKWHVGSACPQYGMQTNSDFDKVTFLGAPLILMGQLYIIGELQEQIYLYQLDSQTGTLVWSQPLGESQNNYLDRMYNLTPVFYNGIMICPTSKNSIVGLDIFQRRLLWGFVSPNQDIQNQRNRTYLGAMMYVLQNLRSAYQNDNYIKGYQLKILNDCVFYTPVKSSKSYIIDLVTGTPIPQYKGILNRNGFVPLMITPDKAIQLGKNEIEVIDVKNSDIIFQINQRNAKERTEAINKALKEKLELEKDKIKKEKQAQKSKDAAPNKDDNKDQSQPNSPSESKPDNSTQPKDNADDVKSESPVPEKIAETEDKSTDKKSTDNNSADKNSTQKKDETDSSDTDSKTDSSDSKTDSDTEIEVPEKTVREIKLGLYDKIPLKELTPEQKEIEAKESIKTIKFPGNAHPVGFGFASGDSYFIPLTNNTIIQFDIPSMSIVKTVKSRDDRSFGNLYLMGDQVYSQTAMQLDCYDIKDFVEKNITEQIKQNPKNIRNLLAAGYLAWDENNLDQAIDYFRRAAVIAPRTCQPILKAVLFNALKHDFAKYESQLESLRLLITDPQGEVMLAQLQIEGLQKVGKIADSLKSLQNLMDNTTSNPKQNIYINTEDDAVINRDIWIGNTLNQLYAQSSDQEKSQIEQWAAKHLETIPENPSAEWLQRQTDYFYFLPIIKTIYEKLYDNYSSTNRVIQAELILRLLRNLPSATDQEKAGWWVKQAALIQKIRPEHAGLIYRIIDKTYPSIACLDGKTAAEYIKTLPQDSPVVTAFNGEKTWKMSQFTTTEVSQPGINNVAYAIGRKKYFGKDYTFLSDTTVRYNNQSPQLMYFLDKFGQVKTTVAREANIQKGRLQIRSLSSDSDCPWWSAEHLFIYSGRDGELSAVSFLPHKPALSWMQNYFKSDDVDTENPYELIAQVYSQEMDNMIIDPSCNIYGNILLCQLKEKVYAGIDIATGRMRWKRELSENMNLVYADNGSFYVTSNESLYRPDDKNKLDEKAIEEKTGLERSQPAMKFSMLTGELQGEIYIPGNICDSTPQGIIFSLSQFADEKNEDIRTDQWGLFSVEQQKVLWKNEIKRDTSLYSDVCIDSNERYNHESNLLLTYSTNGNIAVTDTITGKIILDTTIEAYSVEERQAIVDRIKELQKKLEQEKKEHAKLEEEEKKDPKKRIERIRREAKSVKTENLIPDDFDPEMAKLAFDNIQLISGENGDFYLVVISEFGHVTIPNQAASQIMPLDNTFIPHGKIYKYDRNGKMLWKNPLVIDDQYMYTDIPKGLPFLLIGCNRRAPAGRISSELFFIDKETGRKFSYKGKNSIGFMSLVGNPQKKEVTITTGTGPVIKLNFNGTPFAENTPDEVIITDIIKAKPDSKPTDNNSDSLGIKIQAGNSVQLSPTFQFTPH